MLQGLQEGRPASLDDEVNPVEPPPPDGHLESQGRSFQGQAEGPGQAIGGIDSDRPDPPPEPADGRGIDPGLLCHPPLRRRGLEVAPELF